MDDIKIDESARFTLAVMVDIVLQADARSQSAPTEQARAAWQGEFNDALDRFAGYAASLGLEVDEAREIGETVQV